MYPNICQILIALNHIQCQLSTFNQMLHIVNREPGFKEIREIEGNLFWNSPSYHYHNLKSAVLGCGKNKERASILPCV